MDPEPIALEAETPPARRRVSYAGLVLLYLLSTALHLYLLRGAFRFPHISSDEVQFAMTGENLRLGRGYTLRGSFNSTLPPAFPLFVACAHSAAPDPRAGMFVLSCFLMCSAIFPAFVLGKMIGLDATLAAILATAASLLPHTFYAATYMSEILQYPAYLWTTYLAFLWLDRPVWLRDIAMGAAIGFLLLTKMQGSQLAGAFLIACAIIALRSPARFLAHLAVAITSCASVEGGWALYKWVHAGTMLGGYGRILAEQGLPHWTLQLAIAYVADFLLAPGLITSVLLYYWLRYNGNRRRTIFIAALFGVQILAVSTLDGGLTGWLRERLFLYAIPITAILATKGLDDFQLRRTRRSGILLFAIPLVLIGALMAYRFEVSSIVEVPWANLLGSLAELKPFSRRCLVLTASILAAGVGAILLRRSPKTKLFFATYILLFYSAAFTASSFDLAAWTIRGLTTIGPVITWLTENRAGSGARLLVTGKHGYFDDPALRDAPIDDMLLYWTWRLGLDEPVEWQIETIGRFDVRMIATAAELEREARPGDRVLSTARFDSLTFESSYRTLRLYRIDRALSELPTPRYVRHIPGARFEPGLYGLSYTLTYPRGTYEVKFEMANGAPSSYAVSGAGVRSLARQDLVAPGTRLRFSHSSDGPVTFRIIGDRSPGYSFKGADLEWTSETVDASPETIVSAESLSSTEPLQLPVASVPSKADCYIDRINDTLAASEISLDRGSGVEFLGWAGDAARGVTGESIYIELSSQAGLRYWAKTYPYSRPDVAKILGKPELVNSGFIWSGDLEAVPPGSYRVTIMFFNGARAYTCDPNRSLLIR
jgi:hypothetical protein